MSDACVWSSCRDFITEISPDTLMHMLLYSCTAWHPGDGLSWSEVLWSLNSTSSPHGISCCVSVAKLIRSTRLFYCAWAAAWTDRIQCEMNIRFAHMPSVVTQSRRVGVISVKLPPPSQTPLVMKHHHNLGHLQFHWKVFRNFIHQRSVIFKPDLQWHKFNN